jgi:hypothetical protein
MLAIELADHRYVHHLMCYGGTSGITPAFAADYFGARHVGAIFGFMMLVWAFPRRVRTSAVRLDAGDTQAFYLIAAALAVGTILPWWFPHRTGTGLRRNPRRLRLPQAAA